MVGLVVDLNECFDLFLAKMTCFGKCVKDDTELREIFAMVVGIA